MTGCPHNRQQAKRRLLPRLPRRSASVASAQVSRATAHGHCRVSVERVSVQLPRYIVLFCLFTLFLCTPFLSLLFSIPLFFSATLLRSLPLSLRSLSLSTAVSSPLSQHLSRLRLSAAPTSPLALLTLYFRCSFAVPSSRLYRQAGAKPAARCPARPRALAAKVAALGQHQPPSEEAGQGRNRQGHTGQRFHGGRRSCVSVGVMASDSAGGGVGGSMLLGRDSKVSMIP